MPQDCRRLLITVAAVALVTVGAAAALAESVRSTPSSRDLTPQQWREQQLAAADKSDQIMKDAQKQQGLLGQYGLMQLAYDANHDRAFQLIFGQYLSWYLTYVGD